ncbi:hypothetical protein BU16DRAFT_51520 [Lophium mytilinum]|uniref:Uncharacterized protein n=1 Tax=Lophium mytilinum TaxID=390894 RepID=A0A6A6QS47_9PEZI|nr:hypothetical protein BU16DRAFT_51520 [Lophium mytilinum]
MMPSSIATSSACCDMTLLSTRRRRGRTRQPDASAPRVSAFGRKRHGDWRDEEAVPLAEDDGDTGLVLRRLWRAWLTDDSCRWWLDDSGTGLGEPGLGARDLALPPPSTFGKKEGEEARLGTSRKRQLNWSIYDVSSPHPTLAGLAYRHVTLPRSGKLSPNIGALWRWLRHTSHVSSSYTNRANYFSEPQRPFLPFLPRESRWRQARWANVSVYIYIQG